MRRCTLCFERFELSAANFALTKRGFAYICVSCKSLDNAIRYRRKRIENILVPPFKDQERKIIVNALLATCGNATLAAKLLGIGRATMWRKIKLYKLNDQLTDMELESISMLRKELRELDDKWQRMQRRARVLRRREGRKRAFEKKLDKALLEVRREREAMDRRHPDPLG